MTTWQNQWAVITGGSEGIGRAIALDLARQGAHVTIMSRSQAKLDAALADIEKARSNPSQRLEAKALDVTDFRAVHSIFSGLMTERGAPDLLINCAGYAHPGYLGDLGVDTFHQMMDLNYFGIVNTTKVVVPEMIKRKSGRIVNTSSMAGFIGLFGYTGYCASKYAVIGFSQALRHELKPFGIQVSVLCPPNTRTPGLDRENQVKPREVLAVEEKAKVVNPEQVSRAFLKALARGKFMIVPTFDGSLAFYLSRFTPWLLDQFVKRPSIEP